MKYILVLGDGMADEKIESLGQKTPLEVAEKPCIDNLAKQGVLGIVQTVPNGFKPGSDVANLGVLGYSAQKYYTGRSPLEAASIGVELSDKDLTYRANLVMIGGDEYQDGYMQDYSAGEISTAEAKVLIDYLNENLKLPKEMKLFCGVSYRHCLRWQNANFAERKFVPPHDISGKKIAEYLPSGENSDLFLDIMKQSNNLLQDHPINQKRKMEGKNIANSLWFWGEGSKPNLPAFEQKYGKKGAMISAVDLLKGIAILAKMQSIDVEGATGTIKTNFDGKCQAAINSLDDNDFVFIHLEAPDECGHQGDTSGKIRSIELIDQKIVKPIFEHLTAKGEPFAMLVMPDHKTPIAKRTHTSEPVPFVIYRSYDKKDSGVDSYNEDSASLSGVYFESGEKLIEEFFAK